MAILVAKCPHCKTDQIALIVKHGNRVVRRSNETRTAPSLVVGLTCPNCTRPSCAELMGTTADTIQDHTFDGSVANALGGQRDISAYGFRIFRFWPEAAKPRIPEYLDPDAARALLQAERNYDIAGNEEAAATMYRRTLEISLKKEFPGGPDNLSRHIKKLVADGKLTATIGEWADHIREIGNEAVHETGPLSRPDLVAMREFTDAVLRYAISLPKEIEARRAATVPPADDGAVEVPAGGA